MVVYVVVITIPFITISFFVMVLMLVLIFKYLNYIYISASKERMILLQHQIEIYTNQKNIRSSNLCKYDFVKYNLNDALITLPD